MRIPFILIGMLLTAGDLQASVSVKKHGDYRDIDLTAVLIVPDAANLRQSGLMVTDMVVGHLKEAGLNFRRRDRSLFARVKEMPIDVTFLRTDDIPVLCAEGAIDMGITGADLICESGVKLTERLKLGMGTCRTLQLDFDHLREIGEVAEEACQQLVVDDLVVELGQRDGALRGRRRSACALDARLELLSGGSLRVRQDRDGIDGRGTSVVALTTARAQRRVHRRHTVHPAERARDRAALDAYAARRPKPIQAIEGLHVGGAKRRRRLTASSAWLAGGDAGQIVA